METSTEERGRVMMLGLTVRAEHNGCKEERHFLDPVAAFEQGDVFRSAGYPQVIFYPRYFICVDGEYYPVTVERPIAIDQMVTPARYTRIDFNPGIGVRAYDREVLNRPRATRAETVIAAVMMMLAVVAVLLPLAAVMSEVVRTMKSAGYRTEIFPVLMVLGAIYVGVMLRWAGRTFRKIERMIGIPTVEEWYDN